jgi:NitT/TauT family transport system substrate-binding protein
VVLHVLTHPPGRVTYDDLVPTLADLSATQDDMLKYKVTTARVDLEKFLDDRFARAARSSLAGRAR